MKQIYGDITDGKFRFPKSVTWVGNKFYEAQMTFNNYGIKTFKKEEIELVDRETNKPFTFK